MTEEPVDALNYEARVRSALKRMVRDILDECRTGPPGGHHFYLTFRTDLAGVPADLRAKYPVEITVVIQHQYWDLVTDDAGFAVTLKFSGVPRTMVVPWGALTRFYDPYVQFLLQWPAEEPAAADPAPAVDDGSAPGVIDLAAFRKR